MLEATHNIDPKQFLELAGTDIKIWQLCLGQNIQHVDYGHGTICAITESGKGIELKIDFELSAAPRAFRGEVLFGNGKVLMFTFPLTLNKLQAIHMLTHDLSVPFEQLSHIQDDIASATHFAELKKKYRVIRFEDHSPASPLYTILVKFEQDKDLSEEEFNWLKEHNLFAVMAVHQERQYAKTGNLWRVVYASRCWRQAGLPDKALEVTDGIVSDDNRLTEALLTTRAAAYVDTDDLKLGERLARKAIRQNNRSKYAYAVMARIYSEKGDPDQAQKYGRIAERYGKTFEKA